jgi:hypothetical protein
MTRVKFMWSKTTLVSLISLRAIMELPDKYLLDCRFRLLYRVWHNLTYRSRNDPAFGWTRVLLPCPLLDIPKFIL